MTDPKDEKDRSEKEIAKRADAGLAALLKMPPKPHAKITGKKKPNPKKKPAK